MNPSTESHCLGIERKIVRSERQSINIEWDNVNPDADEAFIEIKGLKGSKTIFRKRVSFLEGVTDAEKLSHFAGVGCVDA